MQIAGARRRNRRGAVYIAVLGTAMMVALLGLSARMVQRIQNRQLGAAADVRQAQLNADAAVQLALLTMKQDSNWRATNPNGVWFTHRGTNAGTCSLSVTDPVDSNLANSPDDPVVVLGIGYSGSAEQRVELTVDPIKEPVSSLRSAIAAGDEIDLQSDTLRSNGLITAHTISATASLVYGTVIAVSYSGSTYYGTTISAPAPTMPDWSTVFDYYRINGTQIPVGNLPSATPNLARNISFDVNTNYWTGAATGLPTAAVARDINIGGHTASLRVHTRTATTAGASQYIDHFVKPGASYNISIQVAATGLGNVFRVKLATKGTGAVQTSTSAAFGYLDANWHDVNVTLTAPSWSGQLQYARLTVDTEHALGTTGNFYIDNIDIKEATTGKFIYRQVLSPTSNPFGPVNVQGIYWIDCGGNRLIIERSRILGTLLVVNPGANSCVAEGPISWEPAVVGYPALLVDADDADDANFSLRATTRGMNEADNEVNFNPVGTPYNFNSSMSGATDNSLNDIYPSEIRGLIVIENNLTYQNNSTVKGQVIAGGDISNSSGVLDVEFLPDSLLNPPPGFWAPYSYLRRPASARKVVLP